MTEAASVPSDLSQNIEGQFNEHRQFMYKYGLKKGYLSASEIILDLAKEAGDNCLLFEANRRILQAIKEGEL